MLFKTSLVPQQNNVWQTLVYTMKWKSKRKKNKKKNKQTYE